MPAEPTYTNGLLTQADGTTITVDQLIAYNGRIVGRAIRDLTLQKFAWSTVFAPAGQITGGSQVYEQALDNQIYPSRDVERIEPGQSYPRIEFNRDNVLTAQVEKFGGEFTVPDESAIRTRPGYVTGRTVKLSNVIVRKTNQRVMAELDAVVTAHSRTMTGTSWHDALALTETTRNPSLMPLADLADIQASNETAELGYDYDFAIFNPLDYATLLKLVGSKQSVKELLGEVGIADWFVTNRQAAGKAKFLQRQLVGEMGYEAAADGFATTTGNAPGAPKGSVAPIQIATKVYRDDVNDQNVVKANVKPIVYVTDPFAIVELDGIAA